MILDDEDEHPKPFGRWKGFCSTCSTFNMLGSLKPYPTEALGNNLPSSFDGSSASHVMSYMAS
jgi:hypothetical protein